MPAGPRAVGVGLRPRRHRPRGFVGCSPGGQLTGTSFCQFPGASPAAIDGGVVPGGSVITRSAPMRRPTAAVVGGGVSGCVCATALRSAGFRVKLFDRGQRLGGRASSHRVTRTGIDQVLCLDHGAQFFRATTPQFKQLIHSPVCEGRDSTAMLMMVVHVF